MSIKKKKILHFGIFFPFQVSWVRNVDSHMLFIGRDRFVHDDRYELISSRHGRWTLKLKYVGARDAGRFECQVSTVPKLNQTFSLKVVGKFRVIKINYIAKGQTLSKPNYGVLNSLKKHVGIIYCLMLINYSHSKLSEPPLKMGVLGSPFGP